MLTPILILQIVILGALVFLLARKSPAPQQDRRLAQLADSTSRATHPPRRPLRGARPPPAQRTRPAPHRQRRRSAPHPGIRRNRLHQPPHRDHQQHRRTQQTPQHRPQRLPHRQQSLRRGPPHRRPANLESIEQRLSYFIAEANRNQLEAREALHSRLNELSGEANTQQEKLRFTVEDRLTKLNEDNAAKLEQMRVTVDEKLHATLQTRLTESFGQVTTHLGEVQKGLGEMKELATGVGDLKKVLSNVKSRGVVGEFQLGQQLEQMFSPEQYIKNARIKPNTLESVEYALKFPNGDAQQSHTLLAIDAKFPKEDWERLEHAYETGNPDEIAAAGKAFEKTIRAEGKRICDKYIDPPTTMPHAIMFLPTEALYAEVVRRPGLQSEIQQQCRVTIAGPSTFMAILTSFQMGFHTLAIQKKGDEVWRVLSSAKKEFETYGGLMQKVEDQVGTVQNTIQKLGVRTRAINKALKNVSNPANLDAGAPISNLIGFEDISSVAPLLAASSDEE